MVTLYGEELTIKGDSLILKRNVTIFILKRYLLKITTDWTSNLTNSVDSKSFNKVLVDTDFFIPGLDRKNTRDKLILFSIVEEKVYLHGGWLQFFQ